ncbi:4-hydroxy-tetrahydrodipicolinate synthase [Rheinheimera sp. UJ51]|uniref:4-hydroxy-tetrahydrodipicolinate synthase n=1 Tax=unclassified Rheinheimera TaxID=115860 RepID=UPI001E41A94F|nr:MULTISPECIES: 4-hydroxy-tetrahydrodipicolinate synthase [unclassified Rheinheimera]MCC5452091.1 4-hydroxy-tetrahydrodipicolinate synthase [Rheinheimera sp. UJ51]MCF4009776.1 4-hydroxy-tetrahydrodipicolinate synthase [Rheinheimera sp. UJ63]
MFKGSIVALVTPMTDEGQVDFESLAQLVAFHLAQGSAGLVIMGTTAEAATLTMAEQHAVMAKVCEQVAGKIPVIAGNGAMSTSETIAKTQFFADLPIDGYLTVTPFYNKPMQKGMLAHFTAVAAATDKPIILYNVPGRTGVDLLPETVAALAKVNNIVGIKEATGSLARLAELKALCPADFLLLSGDDASFAQFMLAGGHGVISVSANVVPAAMSQVCQAAFAEQNAAALAIDAKLQALHQDLFIESNPIPTKWALKRMGLIKSDFLRLPLTQLEPIHEKRIEQALQQAGILEQE